MRVQTLTNLRTYDFMEFMNEMEAYCLKIEQMQNDNRQLCYLVQNLTLKSEVVSRV